MGYAFNITAPVTVTYLGYYDAGMDGLAFAHQVGIWSSSGTLLASTTVPAGTGGLLVGSFRLVALATPVTLGVGTGYTVGGENPINGDAGIAGGTSLVTASGVQFVESRFLYSAGFGNPTFVGGGAGGYYGGNFAVGPAAITIPEPGTVALVGAGLLLAGGLARRRQRTG